MCEKDKIAYHGGSTQLNYGRCIGARSGPVCWMGSSGGSIDEGIQLNPSTRARPPTFLIRGLSLDPKLLLLFEDDCHYGNTAIGFCRCSVCLFGLLVLIVLLVTFQSQAGTHSPVY